MLHPFYRFLFLIFLGFLLSLALGLYFLFETEGNCDVSGVCSIDVNGKQLLPLLLNDLGGDSPFELPNDNGVVYSGRGELTLMACPGNELVFDGKKLGPSVQVVCNRGKNFTMKEKHFSPSEVHCAAPLVHNAKYTGRKCSNETELYEEIAIGFPVRVEDEDVFVTTVELCFDRTRETTLYARSTISKSNFTESAGGRPPFDEDENIFSIKTKDALYKQANQQKTINKLLGLGNDSDFYVKRNEIYLSRGHLSAKEDFVYISQKNATFHFVNVVPQWNTLNGGNWRVLEESVRSYAVRKNVSLTVFTGSYGVATLKYNGTGEETELYLYADSMGRLAIPVPKFTWKVVYDPVGRKAVAFVAANNPYYLWADYLLCKDVNDIIPWVQFRRDDLKLGYVYSCEFHDFRQSIRSVPALAVDGLLL